MDIKTYVTLVRAYSEQLSQLCAELSDTVKMRDPLLSAQEGNTATDTKEKTERVSGSHPTDVGWERNITP